MKIPSVGAKLSIRTDGQTYMRIDMTKLIVVFRLFGDALKNANSYSKYLNQTGIPFGVP